MLRTRLWYKGSKLRSDLNIFFNDCVHDLFSHINGQKFRVTNIFGQLLFDFGDGSEKVCAIVLQSLLFVRPLIY